MLDMNNVKVPDLSKAELLDRYRSMIISQSGEEIVPILDKYLDGFASAFDRLAWIRGSHPEAMVKLFQVGVASLCTSVDNFGLIHKIRNAMSGTDHMPIMEALKDKANRDWVIADASKDRRTLWKELMMDENQTEALEVYLGALYTEKHLLMSATRKE